MSRLYVVRHGQASLFSDDYDKLSDLGTEQSTTLGSYWQRAGVSFDHAWSGKLRRQVETADAVAAAVRSGGGAFPEVRRDSAFDEYPAEDIMTTFGEYLREKDEAVARLAADFENSSGDRERYRSHHRLMEEVMGRWFAEDYGDFRPEPTWSEWHGSIRTGLERVLSTAGGGTSSVLFTSGGVVATILQSVLKAPAVAAAELNWRIHNASVTLFTFSGARISLDRFNDVAHLSPAQLTYR